MHRALALGVTVIVAGCHPSAPETPAAAAPAPQVARSHRAGWQCPFPPESDAAKIDAATVRMRVTVSEIGAPESVEVIDDPGHGFGREAQACAMAQRFDAAQDAQGKPVRGTTKPFQVRFVR